MNATTLTVKAFTEFADQRDWLIEDYDNRVDTAVEEFIRYAGPG
jgi:hypothetical protein